MLDGCVSWGCLLHCLARRINCPDIETLHDRLSMPDYTDLSCSGGCADDQLLNRKGMFSVSYTCLMICIDTLLLFVLSLLLLLYGVIAVAITSVVVSVYSCA